MFLSELQDGHTSSSLEDGAGTRVTEVEISKQDTDLESEYGISDSGFNSSVSSSAGPVSPASPSLECMPVNSLTDLDNPFLSNFTDISLLQETQIPLEHTDPLISGGVDNATPSTPLECNVVVSSSECDVHTSRDQEVFDLSDCVNLLGTSSISDLPLPIPSSSPATVVSPTITPRLSFPFNPYDLSSDSNQELARALSSVTNDSPSDSELDFNSFFAQETPSPNGSVESSSSDVFFPNSPSSNDAHLKISRKRKNDETISEEISLKKTREVTEHGSVDKRKFRQEKNNQASKVSRAKRRERNKKMSSRVKELEVENEKLQAKVEEITAETEKLKKLLVQRLTK